MVMAMWVEESWGAPHFTAALDGHCKVWDAAGSLLRDQHVTNQARTRQFTDPADLPCRTAAMSNPVLSCGGESSGITSLLVLKEPGEEQVLVTACQDNALKLWRMPGFSRRGHSDIVRCLAKGPGASFFSGSMDRSIIVWCARPAFAPKLALSDLWVCARAAGSFARRVIQGPRALKLRVSPCRGGGGRRKGYERR